MDAAADGATAATAGATAAGGRAVDATAIAARGRRYVMSNVPRARLGDVKRLLPGLSGPTVVDVLNGGDLVAVHAVCPAQGLDLTLRQLRELGGTGIVVTRIERLLA